MKLNLKRILCLIFLLFFLGACDQAPSKSLNEEKKTQEVIKASNEDYKVMVPFSESAIRGVYVNADSDTYIDFDNMEEELLDITKEFLNTNDLFYEPGQILDVEDVNILLARESGDNPWGLNPEESKNVEDSMYYTNTIIEQDFYRYSDDGKKEIDTIAFGFGIDTTYEYNDGKKQKTLTNEKIKDFITQYVASKMVDYLEQVKNISDVNIICAFYKESTDSTFPGTYYTYGMIPKDETKLTDVKVRNISYRAYPDYSLEDDEVNEEIINFATDVGNYFENYIGVSAIAKYEDDKISKINIDLIANFYSTSEVEAFSKYVKDNISSGLTNIDDLEIDIVLPSMEILGILEYKNGRLVVDYIKR